ncbi:MAG: hydrogenase expression/formation protein HypE [Desulfobacterales bacterium]|nr:hydrogenase expression/formation protein HypE [Desulfobacterales bacterium]
MNDSCVLLDHGAGGKASHAMFARQILPAFNNPELARQDDGAALSLPGLEGKLAFSTDTYVVDPIFFPGGNIGDLAVNGTVNDISMCGGRPLGLSVGLINEEGFPNRDLDRILESMARAADRAEVSIVTGDTKVVPRGKADGIFINTSGVGILPSGLDVGGHRARPGDRIIVSGTIADHGITILSTREGLKFESDLKTDSAPLNHMVADLIQAGCNLRVLRDPTRGGLGTTLNEIAVQSGVEILLRENQIPVKSEVRGICELLGFDPLYIANEGKLIAIVPPEEADKALAVIRENPFGRDAAVVGEVLGNLDGEVTSDLSGGKDRGRVVLETGIGGRRPLDMLTGEQLPRIC